MVEALTAFESLRLKFAHNQLIKENEYGAETALILVVTQKKYAASQLVEEDPLFYCDLRFVCSDVQAPVE
jgi:hypothetical protein